MKTIVNYLQLLAIVHCLFSNTAIDLSVWRSDRIAYKARN